MKNTKNPVADDLRTPKYRPRVVSPKVAEVDAADDVDAEIEELEERIKEYKMYMFERDCSNPQYSLSGEMRRQNAHLRNLKEQLKNLRRAK